MQDRFSPVEQEAIRIYFERARAVLLKFKFNTKKERAIWYLHTEGFYEKEIVRIMKRHRFKLTRYFVVKTIKEIKKANGLV